MLLVVGMCGLWVAAPGRTDLLPVVLIAFGLAVIGAELATVFTNAMMTSLVSGRRLGTLSGMGWAAGYVGGLVSLVLVAGLLVADPLTGKTLLGLTPLLPLEPATREGDRLVGPFSAVWYLVFVLPLFLFTPDRTATPLQARAVSAGLTQLMRSVRDLVRHHGQVALFLLARMLYADGLGAIFAFGGIYAAYVFGWGAAELGLFGIILTIAGTIGAAARRPARRSRRVEGGDRIHALPLHRGLDRRALGRPRSRVVCAFWSKRSFRAAHRSLPWASRSISPSPFSSGLPPARSRPRAARFSPGCARPAR